MPKTEWPKYWPQPTLSEFDCIPWDYMPYCELKFWLTKTFGVQNIWEIPGEALSILVKWRLDEAISHRAIFLKIGRRLGYTEICHVDEDELGFEWPE